MKHKASLSISRLQYSDKKKKISISVKDDDARIIFLKIEIDLAMFTECLTGLSSVECDIEVHGLNNVGKKIETRSIEFEIPGPKYKVGDKEINRLAKLNTPDGWFCSTYFESQSSFFSREGRNFARTTASRWVGKSQR